MCVRLTSSVCTHLWLEKQEAKEAAQTEPHSTDTQAFSFPSSPPLAVVVVVVRAVSTSVWSSRLRERLLTNQANPSHGKWYVVVHCSLI